MNNLVHLLLSPPAALETTTVKEAAAVLKRDAYEARLLLSGNALKLIAHYQDRQEADTAAAGLIKLGLSVLVIDDTDLHKIPTAVFTAFKLTFGEKELIFLDRSGHSLNINKDNVFLLIKGTLQPQKEKINLPPQKKFNVGATLLMGGIPVWSKVKPTVDNTIPEPRCFIRIYNRVTAEPLVQFYDDSFDFSLLGAKMGFSSLTNMNIVIEELRKSLPNALFDDTLTQKTGAGARIDSKSDNTDVNCRLIYLYRRATAVETTK
jgi:hypothetical protein